MDLQDSPPSGERNRPIRSIRELRRRFQGTQKRGLPDREGRVVAGPRREEQYRDRAPLGRVIRARIDGAGTRAEIPINDLSRLVQPEEIGLDLEGFRPNPRSGNVIEDE
jgi:hypothetical protein